jgi:membrane-bound metal-dependent hydrolase YbcI (DUF457 family)
VAGFHTHIAVSTAVGMGYAMWGGAQYDLPLSTCALAGGLCAIAGTMPDLDSDSGVPARETISLAAALVPMLLFQRFQAHGLSVEHMVLAGAPIYLVIRFGLGSILKSVSVHRGMFHSIPAAVIAGLIGYLICDEGVSLVRYYKAFAVTLGYMTHLILDEMWSLDFGAGLPRVKKSFGTALKVFGDDPGATLSTYCLLVLLGLFAVNDQGRLAQPLPFAKRTPIRGPMLTTRPTPARPAEARPSPTRLTPTQNELPYETTPAGPLPPAGIRRTTRSENELLRNGMRGVEDRPVTGHWVDDPFREDLANPDDAFRVPVPRTAASRDRWTSDERSELRAPTPRNSRPLAEPARTPQPVRRPSWDDDLR